MALNIQVKEGGRVYADGRPITVVKLHSLHSVTVADDLGREFHVTDEQATEVLPGVFVSVGLKTQIGIASLAFEAPKEVLILREELFLGKKAH